MSSETSASRLLSEFPPHTYAEWKAAAEALLKGAAFEKAMITPTYEGFSLDPLYMQEHVDALLQGRGDLPGQGTRRRGARAEGARAQTWRISQELWASGAEDLNRIALHELNNGQDELNVWFDAPSRGSLDPDDELARSGGICGASLACTPDFAQLFRDIRLDYISTYLRCGLSSVPALAFLVAHAQAHGLKAASLKGAIECDPLAFLTETGHLPVPLDQCYDEMASLTRYARANCPGVQTITVSGMAYANSGASSAQELAYVLATGVEYLRALGNRGLSAREAAPHIRLCVSIGSQYFIEVAKFRALRQLWSRVLEAFGVPESEWTVFIHARTGLWNKTVYDPYVNMLRTTTEAFSAVVGGVEALTIGAFDEVIREPDDFSRRIARNTHHILAEECDLAKVVDPAGGAYAVEVLTEKLAQQAWEQFQSIEKTGGLTLALTEGTPQKAIAQVREEKKKAIARRKDVIVGVNNYPNPSEKKLEVRSSDYRAFQQRRALEIQVHRQAHDVPAKDAALAALGQAPAREAVVVEKAIAAVQAGASLQEIATALRDQAVGGLTIERFALQRASSEYEALRLQAEAYAARHGRSPLILQVNFGPSRKYRVRADWTSSFFQVGGFEVSNQEDFTSIEAAVAKLQTLDAPIAVLTADDETYAAQAEALARALKAAKPGVYLLLAGAPGDKEAAYRAAGVDDFVHARVTNYDFNKKLLDKLG